MATGENIKWYSDQALTQLVHSGTNFSPGLLEVGQYTWYVTQMPLDCESLPTTSNPDHK